MGFKDAGKPHYLGHRERLRRRFQRCLREMAEVYAQENAQQLRFWRLQSPAASRRALKMRGAMNL